MKLAWIIFISVLVFLTAYAVWNKNNIRHENVASDSPQAYTETSRNGGLNEQAKENFFNRILKKKKNTPSTTLPRQVLADSIVAYGLSLIGAPYLPAGITCDGFDCSGFIYHIYQKYGVDLPHSSKLLMDEGTEVPLTAARKGDVIIFTGTDENDKTPGHAGVVITDTGEPVAFVHSSSATRNGGVKVSKVDSTGYAKRLLQVRRVL